ncbi:AAA family ATPase [Polaromonas sp.]|uniref:AAA family ATPase n=1 Tax=Polaromonas sp. TaxID=1869339 RepID=UPI003C8C0839
MPSTPTLHFFCGKAGAGKSTIASRLAQDHGAILLSEDIWAHAPVWRSDEDFR